MLLFFIYKKKKEKKEKKKENIPWQATLRAIENRLVCYLEDFRIRILSQIKIEFLIDTIVFGFNFCTERNLSTQLWSNCFRCFAQSFGELTSGVILPRIFALGTLELQQRVDLIDFATNFFVQNQCHQQLFDFESRNAELLRKKVERNASVRSKRFQKNLSSNIGKLIEIMLVF